MYLYYITDIIYKQSNNFGAFTVLTFAIFFHSYFCIQKRSALSYVSTDLLRFFETTLLSGLMVYKLLPS